MSDAVVKGFDSTFGDDFQLNTITFLKYAAGTFPEVEVASRLDDGRMFRYDYAQAMRRVKRLANALTDMGVQPGDRVGVMEWNTFRFFELYFALSGIGAVLLQLNPRISHQDRAYVLQHSGAKLLCVSDSMWPLMEAIKDQLDQVQGYVLLSDDPDKQPETSLAPVSSYEQLLQGAGEEFVWPVIDERSAYSGAYTSGTTGKPKGVFYSHRSIYLHTLAIAGAARMSCEDTLMQTVPMFHCHGWGVFFAAPMLGARLIFPGRYTAETTDVLVDLLISEKVTVTCGAPAIFLPMLHYINTLEEKPRFKNLRMLSGATEPPQAMMKQYAELGADVVHAYGATETSPLVTANVLKPSLADLSEGDKWELRKKQGLPVPGLDWKVVDHNDEEIPNDGKTVGELLVKGPWIASSYYNDSRSEDSFTTDGFWRSGDAAVVDKNGYIKITDRFKDVIKSGGEWISSIDLENAIMAHPQVLEAAVVGINHPKWEERPLALVVVKPEAGEVTQDEVKEFISPGFAKWQLPDEILFVPEIPKTSVGKFSKKNIRETYQDYYARSKQG